jgi:hypothetical protein
MTESVAWLSPSGLLRLHCSIESDSLRGAGCISARAGLDEGEQRDLGDEAPAGRGG